MYWPSYDNCIIIGFYIIVLSDNWIMRIIQGRKDETNVGFSSISEYFLECFSLICSSSSYRSCMVVLLSWYDVMDKTKCISNI